MKKTGGADNERIFKLLVSIDTRITNIEERLSEMATKELLEGVKDEMATKTQLEKVRYELLGEIRVIGKAVDKDALTIVNLEKRVVRIEKHLALNEK